MKIHQLDLILIGACSIAGFLFLLFPAHGNLTAALCVGIPRADAWCCNLSS